MRIFVKKNPEFLYNAFFMNVEFLKKCGKSLSLFEGAPFKHTKTFSAKGYKFFFSLNIHAKCILCQFKIFFHKNTHVIKKKKCVHKIFKLQCYSKVLPNVGGNALFWNGH